MGGHALECAAGLCRATQSYTGLHGLYRAIQSDTRLYQGNCSKLPDREAGAPESRCLIGHDRADHCSDVVHALGAMRSWLRVYAHGWMRD